MGEILKQKIEWKKILELFVFFFLIWPVIFSYLASHLPLLLAYLYYIIVVLFIIQALTSYIQTFGAFFRRKSEVEVVAKTPIPKTTFIVSAYLPNEVSVVEDTIYNILNNVDRPESGIEVILAYNSVPEVIEIEERLRSLSIERPEFILANSYASHSKSENLNYVLDLASGDIIVLLDADHIVAKDCLIRAWRWLESGYDVVQGRCHIRNGSASGVSALIEPEFEAMYGVSHAAKTFLFRTALFGGANGYWKKEVIQKVRFSTEWLTEDIDATMRALLSGYKIIHDRSIVSEELAPTSLTALWYQRKRWAQGWFQCSIEHQWSVIVSKHFTVTQKIFWTSILLWRVFYDIATQFLVPVILGYWFTKGRVEIPVDKFVLFSLVFVLFSGPLEAVAAYKNAVKPKSSVFRYLRYLMLIFPYTIYKGIIQIVAIRDECLKQREWVISSRET